MKGRVSVLTVTIWCLLFCWLCFASLELAEQLRIVPDMAAGDHQDLDQEALDQLGAGLKSDAHPLASQTASLLTVIGTISTISMAPSGPDPFQGDPLQQPTGRASLPLYQRLSVYRL